MRISKIGVRNFRCLEDVALSCDPVTALIGANGSGKSSLLRAVEFFFGAYTPDDDDCFGRDAGLEISVTLTLIDLPDELEEKARLWLDEDGSLEISKVSTPGDAGRQVSFLSQRGQVPEFAHVREAPRAPEAVRRYRALADDNRFEDLPSAETRTAVNAALGEFERAHPKLLERDVDTGLSYGRGGEVDLQPFVRLLSVPAVRDASDVAVESRTGEFGHLIDLLVRAHVDFDEAFANLRDDVETQYREIVEESAGDALEVAAREITSRLTRFAPGTAADLTWEANPPTISAPKVRAELVEGGFAAEIGRQGHGVQRAYLFGLLQTLNETLRNLGGDDADEGSTPLTLLAIEEPELYQHPLRARMLARVFRDLADRSTVPTQILYATHSPLFVSIESVESLRLLRNTSVEPGETAATTVSQVDLDSAAAELADSLGRSQDDFNAETLRPRLGPLTETSVSEGFFANAVVLVEGVEDRALLLAGVHASDVDLDSKGTAVIPVSGKNNLDRMLLLLRQLEIPVYVIFDGDRGDGSSPRVAAENRHLLRLLDADEEDYPETQVDRSWACFRDNFRTTVRDELGEAQFDAAVTEACEHFEIPGTEPKNPVVLARAMRTLAEEDQESSTLQQLVEAVGALSG